MKANSKRPRKKSSARPRKGKTCPRYPHERKLQAVKLPLEEEYSLNILSEELGPCKDTIAKWVQYYLMGGGEALKPVECPLVPQTATSALKNTCHGAYREENLVAQCRSPNIACPQSGISILSKCNPSRVMDSCHSGWSRVWRQTRRARHVVDQFETTPVDENMKNCIIWLGLVLSLAHVATARDLSDVKLRPTIEPHTGQYSPNGKLYVTALPDLMLYDATSHKLLRVISCQGIPLGFDFSRDSAKVAVLLMKEPTHPKKREYQLMMMGVADGKEIFRTDLS